MGMTSPAKVAGKVVIENTEVPNTYIFFVFITIICLLQEYGKMGYAHLTAFGLGGLLT